MPAGVDSTHGGKSANPNLRKATLLTSIAAWLLSGMFHLQALFLLMASSFRYLRNTVASRQHVSEHLFTQQCHTVGVWIPPPNN